MLALITHNYFKEYAKHKTKCLKMSIKGCSCKAGYLIVKSSSPSLRCSSQLSELPFSFISFEYYKSKHCNNLYEKLLTFHSWISNLHLLTLSHICKDQYFLPDTQHYHHHVYCCHFHHHNHHNLHSHSTLMPVHSHTIPYSSHVSGSAWILQEADPIKFKI